MCKTLKYNYAVILIGIIFSSTCFAQFPYTFIEKAHNTNYGLPVNAAYGKDGVVYVSAKSVLRAYKYDGTSLTLLAYIDGDFGDIAVTPDGILLAFNLYRLSAYKFQDSVFQLLTSADDYYETVTVGTDGTVFTANSDTLKAYSFNGTVFTPITKIPNPAGYTTTLGLPNIMNLAVAADSLVFTAGPGGLCVFRFNGSSFTLEDSIEYFAEGMDIAEDGTIFLSGMETLISPPRNLLVFEFDGENIIQKASKQISNSFTEIKAGADGNIFIGGNGVTAFKYSGSSFNQIAVYNNCYEVECVALSDDGTLFIADEYTGLYVVNYSGSSFNTLAHAPDAGNAQKVFVDSNGDLLLANTYGLFGYSYENAQFTAKAFVQFGNKLQELAEGIDGTIITANGMDGLFAYSYQNNSYQQVGHIPGNYDSLINVGTAQSLAVGKDGIIFLTSYDGLRALKFDNSGFKILAYYSVELGSPACIRIDSQGNIIVGGNILASFNFKDSSFSELVRLENIIHISSITFGSDGIVYLTHKSKGISAYRFDGSSFTLIRQMATDNLNENSEFKGEANDIAVSSDGTIFLANGRDGLRAFSFKGEFFQITAHYGYEYSSSGRGAVGVATDSNGIVYLANSDNGLRALTYTPVTAVTEEPVSQIKNFKLYQNYPNPFNPATKIKYSVPAEEKVVLDVYNILGEKIITLVNGTVTAGEHEVLFNGNNLPGGVYIYRLKAGSYISSQKMIYLK